MEMNQEMEKGKVCDCPHHKVVPIAIVVVGIVILLGAYNVFDMHVEQIVLGILALFIGITKLFGNKCGCCNR